MAEQIIIKSLATDLFATRSEFIENGMYSVEMGLRHQNLSSWGVSLYLDMQSQSSVYQLDINTKDMYFWTFNELDTFGGYPFLIAATSAASSPLVFVFSYKKKNTNGNLYTISLSLKGKENRLFTSTEYPQAIFCKPVTLATDPISDDDLFYVSQV